MVRTGHTVCMAHTARKEKKMLKQAEVRELVARLRVVCVQSLRLVRETVDPGSERRELVSARALVVRVRGTLVAGVPTGWVCDRLHILHMSSTASSPCTLAPASSLVTMRRFGTKLVYKVNHCLEGVEIHGHHLTHCFAHLVRPNE
eukprot:gene1222-biopygen1279